MLSILSFTGKFFDKELVLGQEVILKLTISTVDHFYSGGSPGFMIMKVDLHNSYNCEKKLPSIMVASDTINLQFESSHRKTLI